MRPSVFGEALSHNVGHEQPAYGYPSRTVDLKIDVILGIAVAAKVCIDMKSGICENHCFRQLRSLARIRGAMQGYSGFFDLVDVDEDVICRVYELDVSLMDRVGRLADEIEGLRDRSDPGGDAIGRLVEQIESIEDGWDQREDILKGLD